MSRRSFREYDDARPVGEHAGHDVPLVEDPDLPGAGLLLSRANLEAWLTESLGRPCAVELRRLRYKPGTSVVLGFDLITAARLDDVAVTEPCVAWAYADHAAAKIAKTLERIPAEACLAHDPGAHVLVATAAGDRALPLLPRLGEADATARLLDRLLPDAPDPGRARIRTVRHNPGRRWVGVLEREAEPDLLLRAYSSTARMVRAAGCYKTLGRTEVPTPRPIGKSRSLAALAVTWTEGDTLELAGGEDRWRAAGRTLARLHDSTHVKLPTPAPGHEAAAVERAAEQIAHLLPALADEVRSSAGPRSGCWRTCRATWSPCTATSRPTRWWWGRTASRSSSTSTPPTLVRRPPTWAAWWRRPSPRPRRWARRRRASATSRPCWRDTSGYDDRRTGSRWTCRRSRSGFARRPTRSGPAPPTGRSR